MTGITSLYNQSPSVETCAQAQFRDANNAQAGGLQRAIFNLIHK